MVISEDWDFCEKKGWSGVLGVRISGSLILGGGWSEDVAESEVFLAVLGGLSRGGVTLVAKRVSRCVLGGGNVSLDVDVSFTLRPTVSWSVSSLSGESP